MPKQKLLIFTDCDFFAGCEKVLENIVRYADINNKYNIVYVYRASKQYSMDLNNLDLKSHFVSLFLLTPSLFLDRVNKSNFFLYLFVKIFVRIIEKLHFFNIINQKYLAT